MNKLKLNINDRELVINASIYKHGIKFPNIEDTDQMLHNAFKITLQVNDNMQYFFYYVSHNDYMSNKEILSDKDKLFAVRAIFSDAIDSLESFTDFCSNLGYSVDDNKNGTRRIHRIYTACQKSAEKLKELGFTNDMFYDVINKLSEMGIE